jgi:hypothetical protein
MLGAVAGNPAGNYFAAFGYKMPKGIVVFIGNFKVAVRAEAADFTLGVESFPFLCSPFNQLDLLRLLYVQRLNRFIVLNHSAAAASSAAGALS